MTGASPRTSTLISGRPACRRAALWLLALAAACTTLPARSATDLLRLMVAGADKQIYLPVTLAASLGYFKAQGLAVELLSEPSGVNAEDELLSGSVQGVVGFYDHAISLQAKGKFVQAVVQLGRAPGEAELVATRHAADIRSPADFAGRRLGVTGLGSSTQFLSAYLGVARGVRLAEMTMVAVGSGDRFAGALRQGQIDAGMSTEPTVSRLLKSGEARLLVDLRTPQATLTALAGPYPGACLYMSTVWVASHKPQVQKLANALVLALRYIAEHSADEIAAQVPPAYFQGDRALYVEALQASKSQFTVDGVMPAGGPATVLKVLQAVDRMVQGKTIDLSKTYALEYVRAVPP